MGRMDKAPALIDYRMFEQPLDRPLARPGDALLDFLDLFGGVDVNRPGFGQWRDGRKFVWRHGPQAVWRDTDIGPSQRADGLARGGHQLGKLVDRADAPALAGMRYRSTKRAMRVEARQQREPDAGDLGGPRNPHRHLRWVGVGRAVALVMQIVKFADARIPLLEHLDIDQCRDGFGVLRSHLQRDAIHRVAPCADSIRGLTAELSNSRQAALE